MQIDIAYTGSPKDVERRTQELFAEGYRGLWTSETKHDPFLTLAMATRAQPEMIVGTGVAIALARSPFTLAQSAWDLADLSGGRFMLGLGSQVKAHITRRFSMPWENPIRQMREMVGALHAIWDGFETGKPIDFRGEYYKHSLLTPNFNPGPLASGRPLVGLAAVGPQMTALAGEVADFVVLHPFTHVKFLRETTLPALKKGRLRSVVEHPVEIVGSLFSVFEGPMADAHEEAIRQKIAFYGSTPAYRGVLESLGLESLATEFHRLSKGGEWTVMGDLVDDALMAHFRVRAPRDELFQQVQERFHGFYDRVVLTVPGQ